MSTVIYGVAYCVGAVICDDGIMQTSFCELMKKVNKPYERNPDFTRKFLSIVCRLNHMHL